MNLKVIWTSRFKKDYKLAIKRNLNIELLDRCNSYACRRTDIAGRIQ